MSTGTSSTVPRPPGDGGTPYPQKFAGYLLKERLGESEMADVFRAIGSGNEVALKIFRSTAGAQAASTFFREVNASRKLLLHPHILNYSVFGLEGSAFYVVSPYYKLGTLEALLARRQLTATEKISVGLQIASGIAHLHKHGVIHADIKLSNVLVAKDRPIQVVVCDLGLAHVEGAESVVGPHGTLGFSAPEQLAGIAPRPAADVYAFGMTLGRLLIGKDTFMPPARRGSGLHVVSDVLLIEQSELRKLISDCLDEVPARRPSMERVRRTLSRLLNDKKRRPRG